MTVFFPPARGLNGLLAPLVIGILTVGMTVPASAQSGIGSGVLGPGSSTAGAPQQNGAPAPRRPAAVPGSRTEKTAPALPERLASDMAPNEALFDGINRGDMAYVKDAISRGANLSARNILGLTPLDLSIDLGRNDITFLLLSLRGADSASAPPSGKSAKSILQAAGQPESRKSRPARSAREIVSPPPPAAPKLFANDGGTPVPEAGFLGFGTQH